MTPGPPPKDPSTRARRNDPKKGFTVLPAAGRPGKAPAWPLEPNPMMVAELELNRDRIAALQLELEAAADGRTKGRIRRHLNAAELLVAQLTLQLEMARDAEVSMWEELWRTPQAVVWEQSYAHREVAQYVRWKVMAEHGSLDAAKEARQLSDRLGLNPLALLRLHLEIERVEEAEARGNQRRQKAAVTPRRKPRGDPRSTLRAV